MFSKLPTEFTNHYFDQQFQKIMLKSNKHIDRLSFFHKEVTKVIGLDRVEITSGKYTHSNNKKRKNFLRKDIIEQMEISFFLTNQKITLSSGQSSFVNMLCILLAEIEEGDILFFDEVDAFFHPRYCSEFIQSLNQFLLKTKSYAFFITHSVFTAREVVAENIFHFSLNQSKTERFVSIQQPTFNTLGASVDRLADYLFENDEIEQTVSRLNQSQILSDKISPDSYAR